MPGVLHACCLEIGRAMTSLCSSGAGGNRGVGREGGGEGETFRVDSRINVVGVEAGYS